MFIRILLTSSLLALCHVAVTSSQDESPINPSTVMAIANKVSVKKTPSRRTQSRTSSVSRTELRKIGQNAERSVAQFADDVGPRPPNLPDTFPFNPQLLLNNEAKLIGKAGFAHDGASKVLQPRLGAGERSDPQGFPGTNNAINCPFSKPVTCNPRAKYRTITGLCNNLQHPRFGSSNTPFERSLPSVYNDGLSEPRSRSVQGGNLPLPRVISTTIHQASRVRTLDMRFTQITMEFGQFVSHDTERTALSQEPNGSELICCDRLTPRRRRLGCFPIEIPQNDPFFRRFQRTCMEFARALPSPPLNCRLGPRQQLNQETAYLDGSAIYGSSEKLARDLRLRRNGLLRTTKSQNGDLLLQDRSLRPAECEAKGNDVCFKAGDPRVNQQPALMSMHTLWLREHNRVARQLKRLNPRWKDEKLYQEARRIVSAEFQHVVYDEFLPVIVGKELAKAFDFPAKKHGYNSEYGPYINAQITSSFSAAGYRFGHSLVQRFFAKNLKFQDHFLRPETLYDRSKGPSFVIKALFSKKQQKCDRLISEQLTNTLFAKVPGTGIDLAATNIQRGRDFGIPSYNAFRVWCGLSRVLNFGRGRFGLVHHNRRAARLLEKAYSHVDDIDLWTGAVSEKVIRGAVVGPTIACIVSRQFFLLKKGDRFFYENNDQYAKFSLGQLDQIRKASFARIICDNTDTNSVQREVFRVQDRK
ncbi:chorion peroxidase-like [Liolophura sinensis]|uniref:chorion peroxidase-like n=1 Tax=Liolophura sinensis TaxID=3198878 RepID=UPI00315852A0